MVKATSEAEDLKKISKSYNEDLKIKKDLFEAVIEKETNNFVEEKSNVMSCFEAKTVDISESVEKIRNFSDQFVNKGKKAWILKYEETEKDLAERLKNSVVFNSSIQVSNFGA